MTLDKSLYRCIYTMCDFLAIFTNNRGGLEGIAVSL